MKVGDKYICNKTINNIINQPLFIEGYIYKILYIDKEGLITLDHIMYGNEYGDFSKEFLNNNFTSMENISSDRSIFVCTCHSLEHQYSFWYSKEDGLYCEPHLNTTLPFYKRLILGIKYIFGYKSRIGAWDEFIFKKEDLDKLKNIINNI
jgi:hypothetical protein